MKEKFKKFIKNICKAITKNTFKIEMLFFIGLFIIIVANFLVNYLLGMYFLGVMFIIYSIFLYKVSG